MDGIAGELHVSFGDFATLDVAGGLAILSFADDEVGQGRKVRRARVETVRDLRIIVDTSVLEIYLNGGETVLSTRYFQEAGALELKVDCMAGSALAYEMDTLSIDYLVDR